MSCPIIVTLKFPRDDKYIPIPDIFITSTGHFKIKISGLKMEKDDLLIIKSYDSKTKKELENCLIVEDILKSLNDENIYLKIKVNKISKINFDQKLRLPTIYFNIIKVSKNIYFNDIVFSSNVITLKARKNIQDKTKNKSHVKPIKKISKRNVDNITKKNIESKIIENIKNEHENNQIISEPIDYFNQYDSLSKKLFENIKDEHKNNQIKSEFIDQCKQYELFDNIKVEYKNNQIKSEFIDQYEQYELFDNIKDEYKNNQIKSGFIDQSEQYDLFSNNSFDNTKNEHNDNQIKFMDLHDLLSNESFIDEVIIDPFNIISKKISCRLSENDIYILKNKNNSNNNNNTWIIDPFDMPIYENNDDDKDKITIINFIL